MKKGLIFIGEAETGKSRTAQQIRKYYGDSAVYLDGRQFKMSNNFLFASCTDATKVVIIDELHPKFPLEYFYNILTGKLIVNKKNKMPFEIEIDKLIIILDSDKKANDLPQGGSFQRRFDVIEFPHNDISQLFSDTDLILIDDAEKAFDFDRLFSVLKTDR